jgi:hypothetical protein
VCLAGAEGVWLEQEACQCSLLEQKACGWSRRRAAGAGGVWLARAGGVWLEQKACG